MNSSTSGKKIIKNIIKRINNYKSMLKYKVVSFPLHLILGVFKFLLRYQQLLVKCFVLLTVLHGLNAYKNKNIYSLLFSFLSVLCIGFLKLLLLRCYFYFYKKLQLQQRKCNKNFPFFKGFSDSPITKHYYQDVSIDAYQLEIQRLKQTIQTLEQQAAQHNSSSYIDFFIGTKTPESMKKRYHDLVKIYHTDISGGDTATIAEINRQYELKMKETL